MSPAPRATYRLQLRGGVGLDDARALAPYLDALGVSHLYCSPVCTARSGSAHGYDVVDPRAVDPALGGDDAFLALAAALRERGMGILLDWVPNHVGIARGENAWWQDVLRFGRASRYAAFFDVDWEPARPELHGKLLLPVLGESYGAVLESGALEVAWDDEVGELQIRYGEHAFPASPASAARLLREPPGGGSELPAASRGALDRVLEPLAAPVRGPRGAARARAAARALADLVAADAAVRAAVAAAAASLRGAPGVARSFDALHALLERQHYRLAYWRVAAEEVNYRRFFDVDELAALRMEQPDVFAHTHEGVRRWLCDGTIDGLRIDHVDGLADPRGYCEHLRALAPRDFYLVVEKILAADEPLRGDWPVDGTTGYEFLNELLGLFVDPRGALPLERLHRAFTGERRGYGEVLRESKLRVMRSLLAGELESLASRLDRIAQRDRFTRDFTRSALRDALTEIVAQFPVYRTYVDERGADDEDRIRIEAAVNAARGHLDDPGSPVLAFALRVLTGELLAGARGARRRELRRFAVRFQQYTAPVMAKGMEDTSFYRYHRLCALNEVGGDPRRFGVSPDAFHASCLARGERWPRSMLCTASHDTKRGEDTRARLAVLSELPARWGEAVRAFAKRARPHKRRLRGAPAPHPKDEYLLYQVLVGTWPAEDAGDEGLAAYRERVVAYLAKALREGKERSSWRHPDPDYERAAAGFAAALLTPGSAFLETFLPFQREVAEWGALYGLAATALKLAVPGVPDVYQGSELWDLSLADPDNRRPVDFAARRAALEGLARELGPPGSEAPREALLQLLAGWRDGRAKLFTLWRLLALRRADPELFASGAYLPLGVRGEREGSLVGLARACGGRALAVAAPRRATRLPRSGSPFPLGAASWGETRLVLPAELSGDGLWRDVFTGRTLRARGDELRAAQCLSDWPVAALVREAAASPGERQA